MLFSFSYQQKNQCPHPMNLSKLSTNRIEKPPSRHVMKCEAGGFSIAALEKKPHPTPGKPCATT